MNISCKVIEDLLPLYHDGVCSQESRTLVEEHLKTCEDCAKLRKALFGEEQHPVQAAEEKKAMKGIRRGLFGRITSALMLGALLTLGGLTTFMIAKNYAWENQCKMLYEQVILPMEPDEMSYPKEATRYDPSTTATVTVQGTPEYRTDASYRKNVDGYTLSVCAPFENNQFTAILSVFPQRRKTGDSFDETGRKLPDSLHLDIMYLAEDNAGYVYNFYLRDDEMTIYGNFAVDEDLNLMYTDGMTDLEIAQANNLIWTYKAEMSRMIHIARETWPFLTE